MVVGVSAEMILAFSKYHGKKKTTLQEMFKSLSLEMGGDGKTITKDQLSSYVRKAENGTVKLNPTRLKALKKMLDNWDKISKDGENITFADLQSTPMLLFNAAVGDFNDSDKKKQFDDKSDKTNKFDIEEYLKTALNLSENKEITKSDLETHLKSLLSDTSDDVNTDLIDTLTNLIATPVTNIEAEA